MATLVLSTVGGAIGGPIGAAIGALVGQRIDRDVLFAPKGRQGPRLTELAVQTSSYGTQIPKVFGRMRVAGSVIWSTDLIETRAKNRGGKGQPTTTTYSYAASFAVALSARTIVNVGRIWADGKLLRGATGDWKTTTGFRLHRGDETQAPDPLIASAVVAAPAHRGIAYAVFEQLQLADFGNRIPSLTFEVIADAAPVSAGTIARLIGDGVIAGDGPDDTLDGYAASGDTIAGAAEALATATGGWFVARGAAMMLANRVDAATRVDTVTVTHTRQPLDTVPQTIALSHYDPARDYQIGVQRARRGGAGWRADDVDLPAVLPAERAKAIAANLLLSAEAGRATRQAVSDVAAIALRPGDAVTLDDDAQPWRVTRASVEAMRVTLDLAPVIGALDVRPADAGQVAINPDAVAGQTVLAAFELPPIGDTAAAVPQIALVAAGTEPGWRSAAVQISRDGGITWEPAGATPAPGTIGTLAAVLPASGGTLIDRTSIVEVTLAHDGMTLTGADAAALDRGANLAMIGDELVQFADAVQIAPARWRIATFLRGRGGTVPATHAAGARFVMVERDALLMLPGDGIAIGDGVSLLATGVGDGDTPASAATTVSGISVAPPSPVHLAWTREPDGSARVSWVRRSRLGWRWSDGADAPLVEEREAYRVTVSAGGVARTIITSAPEATVLAGERALGPATVTVCQSGTFAVSREAAITIDEEDA